MKKASLSMSILKCVVSLGILIITITYFTGLTFGWFSFNDAVDGNSMGPDSFGGDINITSATLNGDPITINGNKINISVSGFSPGESALIVFDMDCLRDVDFIEFKLLAPAGCETPVQDEHKNYFYFGSQIAITKLTFEPTITNSQTNIGKMEITKTPPINSTLVENGWAVTTTVTPQDIDLTRVVNVTRGSYKLTLQLTFVNAEFDQNILKNFGKPGADGESTQVCYRRFFANTKQNNP